MNLLTDHCAPNSAFQQLGVLHGSLGSILELKNYR